jgi:hypothetical protein
MDAIVVSPIGFVANSPSAGASLNRIGIVSR